MGLQLQAVIPEPSFTPQGETDNDKRTWFLLSSLPALHAYTHRCGCICTCTCIRVHICMWLHVHGCMCLGQNSFSHDSLQEPSTLLKETGSLSRTWGLLTGQQGSGILLMLVSPAVGFQIHKTTPEESSSGPHAPRCIHSPSFSL